MSIDPKNMGNLTCGLTQDPEIINDNILKLRVAADYAGNERDSDNKTGYFNVTMFLNDNTPNEKFVRSQVSQGKMKKGSQIQIAYRLQQDRWTKDGDNRQQVGLVAEAITYAGSAPREGTEGGGAKTASAGSSNQQPQAEIPTEF